MKFLYLNYSTFIERHSYILVFLFLFLGSFQTQASTILNEKTSNSSLNDFDPPCSYTLNLFDTFGDGWNGGFLTLTVNGVSTDYTIVDGYDATFEIATSSNELIVVTFTGGGFVYETSYVLEDDNGVIIWEDGDTPTQGEVFSFFACPTCPGASNVQTLDVNGNNAHISWNMSDSSGVWTVEYGLTGFALGTGEMATTNASEITLIDLLEDTDYEYYISIDCDNGDVSGVVGPFMFHTLWLNDVGIIDISSPTTACALSSNETITITMQNFGQNPQSLITFQYSVNGELAPIEVPLDGFYTGVIGNDSITVIEFETTFDFSEAGLYEIKAWTELETDSDLSNDTSTYFVTSIPVVEDFPYFINFEEWDGGWSLSDESANPTWDFGEPIGPVIASAASGVNAWVTNLSGDYVSNELSYIVSPCFDFSGLTEDPLVRLSIFYDTETNFDGAWLEGSKDSGMTWTKVGTTTSGGLNWYTNSIAVGDVWAGTSGGWISAEHILEDYAGEPDCLFRFGFRSDGSVTNDGIGIDDIFISTPLANDLMTLSVTNSSESICGSPLDSVTIEIRNTGTEDQSGFDISYQVNGGDITTVNLGPITIAPNEVLPYTFMIPFNSEMLSTDFNIAAWTSLVDEQNVANDTAFYTFTTVTPEPLPLVKDFEDGLFPNGWTSTGFPGVGDGHNAGSFVIFRNLYAGVQSFDFTTSILGPINPGDSLTFDYRYTDWSAGTEATTLSGDMLEVQISNDCGETFETLFTIDQDNHTPSATFTNRIVDLDAYGDEVIQIRFLGTWASGDYWLDIDNINILGCPQNFGLEHSQLAESTVGADDGTATVSPSFGTPPYSFEWDDGQTDQTAIGLSAGTYTVTVVDANDCMDVTSIEVMTCPENFNLNVEIINETEIGSGDGSITVSPEVGTGPYTYLWNTGSVSPTINNLSVGTYSLHITDQNGCSSTIEYAVDLLIPTNDFAAITNISLAPNPTQHTSQLNLSLSKAADVQVQVVSIVGQIIFEAQNRNTVSETYQLDLSNYSNGIYFVRIMVDNHLHVEKLVRIE